MTLTLDPPTRSPVAPEPPADDATRRQSMAAGVAVSLGVAACGDDDDRGDEFSGDGQLTGQDTPRSPEMTSRGRRHVGPRR